MRAALSLVGLRIILRIGMVNKIATPDREFYQFQKTKTNFDQATVEDSRSASAAATLLPVVRAGPRSRSLCASGPCRPRTDAGDSTRYFVWMPFARAMR